MFSGILPHDSYFYPRSPCGERLFPGKKSFEQVKISIHALLAESDAKKNIGKREQSISIHALLAESDLLTLSMGVILILFLSTLSLRRATQWRRSVKLFQQFLSTLSLRRATLEPPIKTHRQENFYPRSPCGERRGFVVGSWPRKIFLSTLSLRRAT